MPIRLTRQDAGMLLVCLIWGTNFSVTKLSLDDIPPLGFTGIRFLAGSLLLWGVLRAREGSSGAPEGPGAGSPGWACWGTPCISWRSCSRWQWARHPTPRS